MEVWKVQICSLISKISGNFMTSYQGYQVTYPRILIQDHCKIQSHHCFISHVPPDERIPAKVYHPFSAEPLAFDWRDSDFNPSPKTIQNGCIEFPVPFAENQTVYFRHVPQSFSKRFKQWGKDGTHREFTILGSWRYEKHIGSSSTRGWETTLYPQTTWNLSTNRLMVPRWKQKQSHHRP